MDLILLILGIALIGLLAWLITTYIPMPEFGGAVPSVMP
jgi:hypothetical protein